MNQNWSNEDSCLLVNKSKGIKKKVEDIEVDAKSVSKICSVVIILKLIGILTILTTVSFPYNHCHSKYSKLSLSPLSQ